MGVDAGHPPSGATHARQHEATPWGGYLGSLNSSSLSPPGSRAGAGRSRGAAAVLPAVAAAFGAAFVAGSDASSARAGARL